MSVNAISLDEAILQIAHDRHSGGPQDQDLIMIALLELGYLEAYYQDGHIKYRLTSRYWPNKDIPYPSNDALKSAYARATGRVSFQLETSGGCEGDCGN